MKLHKDLRPYSVVKTFHVFNAKTVEEISSHYNMYIWTETETEIKPGKFFSEAVRVHICALPWDDDSLTIKKIVNMNRYLKALNEWQTTTGVPPLKPEEDIPVNRRDIRLKLIFEELSELAEAYGREGAFETMLCDYLKASGTLVGVELFTTHNTDVLNKSEVLDALEDLQYVISGSVLESGVGLVFDSAFENVHASNMSKFDKTLEDAIESQRRYREAGSNVTITLVGGLYVLSRPDGKILKSHKYTPADMKQFIQ
jgi:predicted HAD superfamily Cof-like phosphohydrolase